MWSEQTGTPKYCRHFISSKWKRTETEMVSFYYNPQSHDIVLECFPSSLNSYVVVDIFEGLPSGRKFNIDSIVTDKKDEKQVLSFAMQVADRFCEVFCDETKVKIIPKQAVVSQK